MARVTRSKKIEIAEDHTAIAIQTPLPATPQKHPEALAEIHNTMGAANLAMDDNVVAKELKSLKAAYRNAIGAGKRGKKPKGRKNLKQDSQGDSEDTVDTTRQLLQSREEDLSASQQQQNKPAPAVRQTRRQMAMAQAGQYDYSASSSSMGPQDLSMAQKIRGLDLLSLFGGRAAGHSRTYPDVAASRGEVTGNFITDYQLSLAEEALSKSMREATVEVVAVDSSAEGEDVADRYDTKNTTAAHTPGKSPVKTLEEVEKVCALSEAARPAEDGGEDSFIKQITCRSPAKPVSRIEDSVEALDKLEEALEALDQVAMAERMLSPEELKEKVALAKAQESADPREKQKVVRQVDSKGMKKQTSSKGEPPKPGYTSMRVKPTVARQPVVRKTSSMVFKPTADSSKPTEDRSMAQAAAKASVRVKRPVSLLPPKEPTKSTKQPTRPTFQLPGEAVAQKLKEQREARLAQREPSEDSVHTGRVVSGPKVKSTKPPTKPTFVLPGEAVSQRKREAHEAKLRAQEEEDRKRREFKAKPIRNSIAPDFVPRETVASLARRSKIGIEGLEGEPSLNKRGSIIVGAHRPSLAQATMANTSAPRTKAPAPVRKPSPTTHGPSMSGKALQRSVSVTDVQVQRQRAKEIYNRDNKMAEDIEREKREREAAAKRAREEAAERGRQASREWAEKQLAKKMAAGDKGLSAGYGPGGQMGLKA
ncbi:hypothetical protein L207DRAFT_242608 [Hyaloscypha variabilis F]|uniref:Carboxylesterase family protein n=1 Tax=Hyaloscypha variabilis (strain UAMH 11265 / GT02V1 / F) TaxID=1149755 RepID=A0A2J6S2B2_HYAVF|nr:hypothetical protein L207DRAFT_242608 [Hyaloscypha variabilis F]